MLLRFALACFMFAALYPVPQPRDVATVPAAAPVVAVPRFQMLSCALSQAPKAPGPIVMPAFGDGRMAILPQQYYEPTIGDDARLDRTLTQWGCSPTSSGYLIVDLEYTFGVMGERPVTDADFTDPRTDAVFHADVLAAIARLKASRPLARVGFYLPWVTSGCGLARTDAELQAQRPARLVQQRLNNSIGDVLAASDFVAVSLYRRGEVVGGDPMNFDVRDAEAIREVLRCRDRANKACELFVMVSALVGPFQTGTPPIRPEAVCSPVAAARLAGGFAGAVYWGNAATNQEYDWLLKAGDRVAFAATWSRSPAPSAGSVGSTTK